MHRERKTEYPFAAPVIPGVEAKFYYVISADCVMCASCAEACPVHAITEGDGRYEIDPERCIDCVRAMTSGGKNPLYLPDLLLNRVSESMPDTLDEYHSKLNSYIEAH